MGRATPGRLRRAASPANTKAGGGIFLLRHQGTEMKLAYHRGISPEMAELLDEYFGTVSATITVRNAPRLMGRMLLDVGVTLPVAGPRASETVDGAHGLQPADSRVADILDSARRLVPLQSRHLEPDNGEGFVKDAAQMAQVAEEICRAAGERDPRGPPRSEQRWTLQGPPMSPACGSTCSSRVAMRASQKNARP